MNLSNDAGMHARPPKLDTAARESRELLNILRIRRPEHTDAVLTQVAFIVESSRIAVVARRMQLRPNPNPSPVSELDRVIGRSGHRVI